MNESAHNIIYLIPTTKGFHYMVLTRLAGTPISDNFEWKDLSLRTKYDPSGRAGIENVEPVTDNFSRTDL